MSLSRKPKTVRTVKPGLTVHLVGQHSSVAPGIHPVIDLNYVRRSAQFDMPKQNLVKENKFAIITIMLKCIARDLREKMPDLHIKAHPMDFAIGRARLVVRKGDIRVIIDVRQGPVHDWRKPKIVKEDPNEYNASVKVSMGNDVSKKKTPQPWSFSLDDPDSTIKFEAWVDDLIEKFINASARDGSEAEHSVDPD